MIIYEPRNTVKVITPKGVGRIWLVTEYGLETQKLFTCIIDGSGQIWEFTNSQITVQSNPTIEGFKD
jgi:hypothetical protein